MIAGSRYPQAPVQLHRPGPFAEAPSDPAIACFSSASHKGRGSLSSVSIGAAHQFIEVVRGRTFDLAETGVNLKLIVDHAQTDSLRPWHLASRDQIIELGSPNANL
jgi:hypothetical protein